MSSPVRIPLLFVLLWSSAYIAFEACSTNVEPATYVVIRSTITAIILAFIVFVTRVELPSRRVDFIHCSVVGILIHGGYTGGVFASIYHDIDIALCALILSLQPLLTLLLSATFLGEKITQRKAIGIFLALIGVSIVIAERSAKTAQSALEFGSEPGASNGFFAISICCVALLAISSATIMQKRYCSEIKPMAGNCIQFTAAAIFMLPIAAIFETMQIHWSINFILGMSWLIIGVSLGAMTLLMILIKQGEAGSVANLFYLVTPLVTVQAWLFFGYKVTLTSIVGMLLCMIGVVIVNFVSTVKPSLANVST